VVYKFKPDYQSFFSWMGSAQTELTVLFEFPAANATRKGWKGPEGYKFVSCAETGCSWYDNPNQILN